MLSQQDESFKHISRLCKRRSHCCSAVYTAVNSSFKWKELWWSFFGTTVKTIKVWCVRGHSISDASLSAFAPQEDQVPLERIGGTDHEKDLSLMFHIISHRPSALCTMQLKTPQVTS